MKIGKARLLINMVETFVTIPIDDMKLELHPGDTRGVDHWTLTDRFGEYIGDFHVDSTHKPPSMRDALLASHYHGQGIGKSVYKELINHYKELISDINGVTSKDASLIWKSLGAKLIKLPSGKEVYYVKS